MLIALKLAFKLLKKEWRSWVWYILLTATAISIAAVTALNFYTSQVQFTLQQQGARILGGDLVLVSSTPIPPFWVEQANKMGLKTAQSWSYPSMASIDSRFQLINIQAVSANFPLIGTENARPAIGSIWVEPRLLSLLAIKSTDSLSIGEKSLPIAKTITGDIQVLNTGWLMAPRVLMRIEDIPATKTILPGSRIEYRLLLTGDAISLKKFQTQLTPNLQPNQRFITIDAQQSLVDNTFRGTQNYLQLTLLICFLMSGVAISLSIRQYLATHYNHVALWRCLGLNRKHIIYIFIILLSILGLFAILLGVSIGYLAQALLAQLAKAFIHLDLLSFSFAPIIKGTITGIFLLFAFALPIIIELPNTPPLFLWRKEVIQKAATQTRDIALSLIVMFLLLYWIDLLSLLTLFYVDLILISMGFLFALQLLFLAILRRIASHTWPGVRQGLNNLIHHPESVSLQFTGLTLVLTCLLVLGMVKSQLIGDWRASLPEKTANYFAFNIAHENLPALQKTLNMHNIRIDNVYPMVRGRLTQLNHQPIMSAIPESAKNHNSLRRELNLSWMIHYPADNQIVKGAHWTQQDAERPLASVEESLANTLNIKIGDSLTFRINEKDITATVSNIRKVDWGSFHPNFYVIFTPDTLRGFNATYITSFYAHSNSSVLNDLIQQFPNITIIDIASLLLQVQELVQKLSLSLQFLFLFSLAAGALIMLVSFLNSIEERRETYQLLKTLGASKRYIATSIMIEYVCLFASIIITAYALSRIIIFAIAHYLY